ncbi:MAG: hypothetical protein WBQ36_14095, partial [Desulfobaccales bacterium]
MKDKLPPPPGVAPSRGREKVKALCTVSMEHNSIRVSVKHHNRQEDYKSLQNPFIPGGAAVPGR